MQEELFNFQRKILNFMDLDFQSQSNPLNWIASGLNNPIQPYPECIKC